MTDILSTDRAPEFQVQVYIILDAVKLLCGKVITLNYWGLEEAIAILGQRLGRWRGIFSGISLGPVSTWCSTASTGYYSILKSLTRPDLRSRSQNT